MLWNDTWWTKTTTFESKSQVFKEKGSEIIGYISFLHDPASVSDIKV